MFFWRKKKRGMVPPPPPEVLDYYWVREKYDADTSLFSLSHSVSEFYDLDAFTAISKDILRAAFSGLWVSMWIYDKDPKDFLFPDGWRCIPPKSFPEACLQYLQRTPAELPILLQEDGDAVLFSHGICLPIFEAYLSGVPEFIYNREVYFRGYKQAFTLMKDYGMEKDRPETASWDTHAFFDELHHNLLLYVKQPYDPAPLARIVQESCEKYGKELHISER